MARINSCWSLVAALGYPPAMPRLFVAIDFPEAVTQRLAALCSGLAGARWLPPEQFHLTLRFIGEVDSGAFADIVDDLSAVACPPFSLSLGGVGYFPPRGEPRVLWAGVDVRLGAVEELARLQSQIESRLRLLGIEPEGRKFAPHVTLARLKGTPVNQLGDYLIVHGDFITETIQLTEFHLYSSVLRPKGALHRIEASYPLEA